MGRNSYLCENNLLMKFKYILTIVCAVLGMSLLLSSCNKDENIKGKDGYFEAVVVSGSQTSGARVVIEMNKALDRALPNNSKKTVQYTDENVKLALDACQEIILKYIMWTAPDTQVALIWYDASNKSNNKSVQTWTLLRV